MMDDERNYVGSLQRQDYNDLFKERTKKLALQIIKLYRAHCQTDELRIIGKQLIRSVTSVAANYRAVVRARSSAEKYSKLCIVVEEADETVFWLELLMESKLIQVALIQPLINESLEILMVMSAYKKKYKG